VTSSPQETQELFELLNAAIDGPLSDEQTQRLEGMLKDNPPLQEQYLAFFLLSSELHFCVCQGLADPVNAKAHQSDTTSAALCEPGTAQHSEQIAQIKSHAERQLQAYLAEQSPARIRAQKGSRPIRPRWDLQRIGAWIDRVVTCSVHGVIKTALIVGVLLVLLVGVRGLYARRVIGTLQESTYAQWDTGRDTTALRPGCITLNQGTAKLQLTSGAELLLQAPCMIDLQHPKRVYLEYGSLCATVPTQARGFTVRTLTSQVVDYGTEFGVRVDAATRSEIHVFQGSVGVGRSHEKLSELRPLSQGHAAWSDETNQLQTGPSNDRFPRFLRKLPEPNQLGIPGRRIDLGDIVRGNNGFGLERPDPFGQGDFVSQSLSPLTGVPDDPRRFTRGFYAYHADKTENSGMRYDVLDGTWDHQNDSDQWDGLAIGEGNPGGVSLLSEQATAFIRFQDTGDPAPEDPNSSRNQKLYLGHRLDFGLDGVILEFRTRLACTGPLDPLHDTDTGKPEPWPARGVGTVIAFGGMGMFTIAEGGRGPISFSLAKRHELVHLPGYEDLQSDVLVMNNLVGNQPSSKVDTEKTDPEIKARNWLPVTDITQWHTFRIRISEGGRGTHRVDVSVDGQPYREFEVTIGEPRGNFQDSSYVGMGCPFTIKSCAFDLDYLSVCSRWEQQRDLPREQWEGDLFAAMRPTDGYGRYQPVAGSPYIDGVFVPDADHGPCIVSSEGHVFTDCPDTDGMFTYNIMHRRSPSVPLQPNLTPGGADTTDRGGIAMHANTGLTFDLQAMCSAMPHARFVSFITTASMLNDTEAGMGQADIWVLVDGQARYSETLVYNGQPLSVEVPLEAKDRFLTLVVNDSGRLQAGYRPSHSDLCYFSEPVLNLSDF
jgi:hypothetical protein